MKKIVRVALKLGFLTDKALAIKVGSIIANMTDNVHFPGPLPELDALTTALARYEQALIDAQTGARESTALKNSRRASLEQAYRNMAGIVESKSDNDHAILLTSGYDARKTATQERNRRLEKPAHLRVQWTDAAGTIKLSVAKILNARSYMFQYALGPHTDDTQWITLTGTARTMLIDNLESGKQYSFRVGGIGPDPIIIFSDVVTRYVP